MARKKKGPGRPLGRTFPEHWQMYSTKEQKEAWGKAATAMGLRSRNDFLRLAGDHALTCPLFLQPAQPADTINEG